MGVTMTLALDTNIFISSLVSYEKDSKLAVNLIRDIINGKYKAIASSVVYGEIISIPLNSTKPSPMSFISRINNLNTVPADDDICLKAAEIRKNEGSKVKLIDTLHLATAL